MTAPRTFTLLAWGLLLIGLSSCWSAGPRPTLHVIGDSTASTYGPEAYPRMGWAQVLGEFFVPRKITVANHARSGRSSKSFYHEPAAWPVVKAGLRPGDFLFIQFGHNDAKPDSARATRPFSSYQAYLSRYLKEARAAGVQPVLLTSIHRNAWEPDTLAVHDTHGDYLRAMRALATETGCPLIDLASLTDSLYEAYGYTACSQQLFLNLPTGLYPNYPTGSEDNSHLQEKGAYELAKLVANALASHHDPQLEPLRAGLHTMVKVPLRVSPPGAGYIQGPRYLPVDSARGYQAGAAPGFGFEGWEVEGKVVSREPDHAFSGQAESSPTRVARFEPRLLPQPE